ncbi:MAG: PQQ-binding-like beta-propeller repeat protein [Anaerolineales bacterium]|nr:PQQ-binding-like beta-propeller repeat protein [Anaerolineales bacterium]
MRSRLILTLCLLLYGCGRSTAVSPPPPLTAPAHLPTGPAAAPQRLWEAAVGAGLAAPAMLAAGRVIAASETAVIAFDPQTGAEAWRVAPPGGVWPRALAADDARVYVGTPGGLLALHAADGSAAWQQATTGEVLWPPLADGELVIAGTAHVGPGIEPDPAGRAWVVAWDAETGALRWEVETAVYTLVTPAAAGDLVVAGGSYAGTAAVDEGGHMRLHALGRQDGRARWTAETTDGFLKSLAVDANGVYYLAYTDRLVALDAGSGAARWQYPTENWSPGFAYADGALYLGSDNAFVHAVDAESGVAQWRVPLSGVFNSPRGRPAVGQHRVYFQGNDNGLYALDRATGQLVWQTAPQPRSRVAVAVEDGRLYLAGQDGTLYAYGVP